MVAAVLTSADHEVAKALAGSGGVVCATSDELLELGADAILSAGNQYMFPPNVIQAMPFGIINFHAAPLPEYRGSSCAAFAILNGATTFGASFHLVDATLDTGPILHVETFPIAEGDCAADLDRRAVEAGLAVLEKLGAALFNGSLEPWPQSDSSNSKPFRRGDLAPHRLVSLDTAPDDIWRHVRACDWDGVTAPAFIDLGAGRRVYLTSAPRGDWIGRKNEAQDG